MATHASATSPTPWRSRPWARAALGGALLGATLFACEASAPPEATLTIDAPPPAVLEMIAERDGVTPEEAARTYEAVILLSDSFRARQEDPARRQREDASAWTYQSRAILARLWLKEVFEREVDADSVPPEFAARFRDEVDHPKLHLACQVIVMPTGPADEAMFARAKQEDFRAAAAPLAERIAANARGFFAPGKSPADCDSFTRIVNATVPPSQPLAEGLRLKQEQSVFPSCDRDRFVEGWVDAMCPVDAPGVIGPFWTDFGAHVVYVAEVLPTTEGTPASYEAAARNAALDAWRTEEFPRALYRVLQRLDVQIFENPEAP